MSRGSAVRKGSLVAVALAATLAGSGLVPPSLVAPAPGGTTASAQEPQTGPPVNELSPEVDGRLREGEVITTSPGRWSGAEPLSFSNRWERCDTERCTAVEEQTSFLYRLVADDVGKRMRGVVTATNDAGTATAYGRQSALVRPRLRPLDPFPVVAVRGYITSRGTLLTRLAARAPAGSTLRLRCRGRGCPYRRTRLRFRRHFVAVRTLHGRTMGHDAVIVLTVTKGDTIGKYTRIRFRRNRRPARVDRCVTPDEPSPSRCPREVPR